MSFVSDIVKDSISIESKELEPCLRQVDVTVPADKVETGYNRIAKEFAKQANIQGFRPGKAPLQIVKKKYQSKIEEELLKDFVSNAFQRASDEEETDVLTYSFVDDKQPTIELGSDLKFSFRFNVAPKIELPEYKGLNIEIEKNEISEEDIQEKVDYFREMYGQFQSMDTPAEEGDMLKVSYTSNAELSEEATDSVKRLVKSDLNYIWLNKENESIPGVNETLKGRKADETVEHTAQFPSDFEESELAGKTIDYEIKIEDIQRKAPLSSDDELCKKMMFNSVEELKNKIREQSEKELEGHYNNQKRNKVIEKLTQNLDFSVPPDMLDDASKNELNQIISQKTQNAEDKEKAQEEIKEQHEDLLKEAKETATHKLRTFLLLKRIAKEENIEASEKEVDQRLQQMSYYYGYKPEDLKKRLVDNGNISQVFDDVLANKVTDFLVEQANVTFVDKKEDQKEDNNSTEEKDEEENNNS